ncbi:transcriptional regulator family protein [Collimonas fungivorans]|uniref:Transcriptional regulator family protein n=1 Tax=Collimonas fungivorans TaxID=158899 RepID=A0A127PED9_9BURK|nr:transcriptional regulator family protein [Collimonas fungivorans]
MVKATVGKAGGYTLSKNPKDISLLNISHAINPPDVFAIHTYEKKEWCVVSNNIKEVMGEVLAGTQKAVENDLKQTTLADVVSKIRSKSR